MMNLLLTCVELNPLRTSSFCLLLQPSSLSFFSLYLFSQLFFSPPRITLSFPSHLCLSSTHFLLLSPSILSSWFMIFTHVWKGHWPLLYNERTERVSIWTWASRTLWAHHHGNLQRDPHLFRVISTVIEFYNVHFILFFSFRFFFSFQTCTIMAQGNFLVMQRVGADFCGDIM